MLEIDPGILVAQMITFFMAVFLLWKCSWKSICAMLNQRRETIRKDLELIEETRRAVQQLEKEYQEKLADIHGQAQEQLALAKQEAQRVREQIVARAQEDAEGIRQKARLQVDQEGARLLQEVYDEISQLSMELAGRLVSVSISQQDKERLFEQTLKELEKVA